MIKTENLNKVFRLGFLMKEKHAVKDLNLEVSEGSIYGFVGPNGAGKSTTIKMLLGLLRKTSGKFELLGQVDGGLKARQNIGYLPEHPYFYDYLSGYELLEFYGKLLGVPSSELVQRIKWALSMVHANQDWIHSKLRSYSKGMMQRVGLAQAILNQPKLLILDEPMSGLDPIGRQDVRNSILELNKMGTTVFYSSHVLSDVEAISSHLGIIIQGQMRKQGNIDTILNENKSVYQIRLKQDQGLEQILNQHSYDIEKVFHNTWQINDDTQKDSFLKLLIENDFHIQDLEQKRPSLEEVLTKEIAKNV